MLHKSFEITIPFVETEDGWRPIIEVVFIKPNSPSPLMLALEFDTGADSICLSSDMEWAFPSLKSQKIYGVGSKRAHQGKITRGEYSCSAARLSATSCSRRCGQKPGDKE